MSTAYPFPIFVYPTLRCNFSCSYCFTYSGPTQASNSFLLDCWDKLLNACATLGVPEIRLSGGEPLLIGELAQRCRAILARGMRYTLLTNGSLLERHLGWLADEPPETLWISYHREFSSVATFARRVARAVEALPRVGVHVFSCDVAADAELVDRAVRAGAQRIKILSLTPIGRYAEASKTERWSRAVVDTMLSRWQALSTRPLEVRVEAPALLGAPTGASTCVLRERPLLSIDHNGAVYPCCVTLGVSLTALGSLQHEPLETIVRRANSPARQLPCHELLPSISMNHGCCPLKLVTLSVAPLGDRGARAI